jgi:sulfatase maturation enzyme AslB (radical SAM superfamily)
MPEQKLTKEQRQQALGTVLFQLPDCKECGMSLVCHDTCYEKTRVEDAEKQALATWEKARQQAYYEIQTDLMSITCKVENPFVDIGADEFRKEGFESARQAIIEKLEEAK